MKINPIYKLRSIAGETIVVNQGTAGMDMTRIISLNASAKLLYESLAEKEFTTEDAAHILTTDGTVFFMTAFITLPTTGGMSM